MKWTYRLAAMLAAGLLATCAPQTAMAQKIDSLPAATTLGGTEQLRGIQGSGCLTHTTPCVDVRVSTAQIATLAAAGLDAKLVNIAGLSPSANSCFYFTSSTAVASYSCSSIGRTLAGSADAAAARSTLGLGSLATQSGTFSGSSSGTNTGDQTITLTGDVTGSGGGSFAATIGANKVTFSKFVAATQAAFVGATAAGNFGELTPTQATAQLNAFTSSLKGLAPASGGGTTNFLRADGTWAAPSGGGSGIAAPASPAADDFLQYKAGAWTNRTVAQVKADLGLPQSADVQIFNVSGTWTKPAFGTTTRVILWGGGGGGGNGVVAAASTASSGGGGGAGALGLDRFYTTSSLGSTETVTVGAGGAIHSLGGNSSFGSWITAYGAGGGADGSTASGAAGGSSSGINIAGANASGNTPGAAQGFGSGAGAAGGSNAPASNQAGAGGGSALGSGVGAGGAAGLIVPTGAAGGGSGAGISSGNVAQAGAAGGGVRAIPSGGTLGAINGGNGASPSGSLAINEGGAGGGGGGSNTGGNGGNGGAGQAPGGGGGGGGSAQTGSSAGTGGVGGAGKVIVITY